ncbi:MAG: PEP/pyruvate-binding domain-containing protein, partial [Ardenticatenaceae bacterium]
LGLTPELTQAILSAYQELLNTPLPSPHAVAVRSSAAAEDLADSSFAGMQETVLNVTDEEGLLAAVRRVWASVESLEARAYRERAGVERAEMAVVVQRQVAAIVAGVAFARDPVRGEDVMVIEAVAGLGDALLRGEAEPQHWRLARAGATYEALEAPTKPLLDGSHLHELAALVETAGAIFGAPQDVEWAYDGERIWLLQSRPITGRQENWFTDYLPGDTHLWTAAFLDERFTEPVSPLGWSLVAPYMEGLALRGPLELLGAATLDGPLLKLWRGHPYSRVEAWQRIYKLFPEALLPEDAARYFPEDDTSLRHAPRLPVWGLQLLSNGLRALRTNFHTLSPLHNPRAWDRYEQRQEAALIRFHFEERQLVRHAAPVPAARALLQEVADLTADLLELHRWSLLYADLTYSLLRRLLILRLGPERGAQHAVELTSGVESPTTQMNRELAELAANVGFAPGHPILDFGFEEWEEQPRLVEAVHEFLDRYGHRFFSLDIYDPPWEADLPSFLRLFTTLA